MLGFINIYKPSGVTSNDVVQRLKRKFHLSKIGHMGTLDPIACGILPIAIGKATRLFDYSLNKTKTYIAVFDFGYTTDTLDTTGIEIAREDVAIEKEDIIKILPNLIGDIDQIPPRFSAKNINGRRAYDLAREGQEFELKPKKITIYRLELLEKVGDNRFKFLIKCSSGTYIRSIGRDMAQLMGTMASMSFLERIETGEFNLESSIDLDTILDGKVEDYIISPLDVFPNFGIYNISNNQLNDVLNGKNVLCEPFEKETFIINNNKIVGVAIPHIQYIKLNTFLYE